MAEPRANPGERWLIRNVGWRIIVSVWSDRHGRLYGIRHPMRYYALTPVSSCWPNRGRFVRSRDLIRRDKRNHHVRPLDTDFKMTAQDGKEGPSAVKSERGYIPNKTQ